jgi:hypothetical protein
MEQLKKVDWAHIRRGGHRFEALIVDKKSKRHIAGWIRRGGSSGFIRHIAGWSSW